MRGTLAANAAKRAIISHRIPEVTTSTTWTAGSGSFATAADWSNGVPTTGVDAIIDSTRTAPLTITYSGAKDTANSLTTTYTTFDMTSGTLTLQSGSSFSSSAAAFNQSGGKIDFQNGESLNETSTISGTASGVKQTAGVIQVDQGALGIEGNSSFAGTVTGLSGGGTLVLDSQDTGATYVFTKTAVLSIGELVLNGGTTTIDSGAKVTATEIAIDNNAVLDLAGGLTYGGNFDDISNGSNFFTLGGSTLTLTGTAVFAAFNGAANIDGPGTLVLTGTTTSESNYGNQVILGASADLINTGTFIQNGNFQVGDGNGNLSGVDNSASGTWDIVAGTNLFVGSDGSSSFTNAGLFEDGGSNTGPVVETVFVNTGIVSAAASDSIYFNNQLINTGTLAGPGQIAITGGSATFGTGTVLSSGELGIYGGTTTLTTNLAYANDFNFSTNGNATLALGSNTLSLTGTVALGAFNGSALLTGSGTLALSGATNTGSNYNNVVDVGGTVDLVNGGTLTQAGNVQIGDSSGGLATITNLAGAVWNATTGNGIGTGANGASSFVNKGLFENTGSNTGPTVGAVFTNSGTISIAAGDAIAFDNTLTNAGTIAGAGTLALTGGTTTFGSGTVLSVGAIDLAGSVLNIGANLAYSGAFTDSSLSTDSLNTGKFGLRLNGPTAFQALNGSVDLYGSGTISLFGATTTTSNYSNMVVVAGTETLANSGDFTEGGNFQIGDGNGGLAHVTNSATGTWNIITGNLGVGSDASSSFTNAGLFENSGTNNSTVVDPVFNNTGTVDVVNAGTSITFEGGGSLGGTLAGAGTIALDAGVFSIVSGVKLSVASLVMGGGQTDFSASATYSGTFAETGGTIDLTTGTTVLDLTGTSVLGATITGSGKVEVGSTSVSSIDGLVLGGMVSFVDEGGVVSQGGQVTIGTNSSSTAQLQTVAGSTYRITVDVGIGSAGTGAITNAGVFEKSAGTGTSVIDALVTNSGTLEAASGTLDFAANVTNNGVAEATTGHTIEFGASLSATAGDSGTVDLTDGGLAQFGGYVGSSQTLAFLDTSTSEAFISAAGQFAASIKGFGGSNSLLLSSLSNVKDTYSGTTSAGVLTLTEVENGDTVTVAQLHFTGDYSATSFTLANNPGGVLITFAGAEAKVVHPLDSVAATHG
jgi:hypothetical protein